MADIHDDQQELERRRREQAANLPGGRDLGTVGGGSAPGAAANATGSGSPNAGMSSSSSNVNGPGTPGEGYAGVAGVDAEGSSKPTAEVFNQPGSGGEQGNLGGRNPGQPRNAFGDQDATQNQRGDADMTDPMSSRAPDKLRNKQ